MWDFDIQNGVLIGYSGELPNELHIPEDVSIIAKGVFRGVSIQELYIPRTVEDSSNSSTYDKVPKIPTRIRILQWVIQAIAVAVEALAVVWHLNIVVWAEEPAQHRVV